MNKLNKIYRVLYLLAFIALFLSCNDENEFTDARLRVEMKAASNTLTNSNGRTMEMDIAFNEVLVGVTEIDIELKGDDEYDDDDGDYEDGDDDSDDYEIEYEGNFIVDLINGTSTPDFGFTSLPSGIYEELEIEMEPILDNGNTIFVSFDYTNTDDETVTVEYSNDDELEFELENEDGFTLDGGALNQILVIFDLDLLFDGIDLSSAQADQDGVIRINDNSNESLAAKIESNLDKFLEAGDDDDDDDEFDDD